MARALVLACLALALPGAAAAQPKTRKVTIETEPRGAKVYFGVKEDGEVCTTPCTVDAPIGETPIIIEAENRRAIIENLIVPRRGPRPLRVHYKLEPAIGTLVIEGGDGAVVKIDEEIAGRAPARIEGVLAGAHHVVLERDGKPIYDQFIEVDAGREETIAVSGAAPVAEEPEEPEAPALAAVGAAPVRARRARGADPVFTLGVAMDVGFRQFTYLNNRTPRTQRDDRQSGQVMAGPMAELWPTRLLGWRALPGLAIHGRYEHGLNSQRVVVLDARTGMKLPTSLSTTWRSFELGVRHRWALGQVATADVGVGYTRDRYQFKGDADELAIVPDASYQAIRIGGRVALALGRLEPFLAVESRLVLSGGVLDARYSLGTSVSGLRAALGGSLRLGPVAVRVEGGLTRYRWTFRPDTPDAAQADGATDTIESVSFIVCYAR